MHEIRTIDDLQSMKWYSFEKLTKELLLFSGYEKGFVTHKGVKGGDDGIDVIVKKILSVFWFSQNVGQEIMA